MKQTKKQKAGKRVELDAEVVADLEATDAETEAIQGGGRGQPVSGAVRSGIDGGTGT